MPRPVLCPNAGFCNFFRTAQDSHCPDLNALVRSYCCDPGRNGLCFRATLFRKKGANLSGDIAPNATVLRGLARVLPSSDLAMDQAARVYALSGS